MQKMQKTTQTSKNKLSKSICSPNA